MPRSSMSSNAKFTSGEGYKLKMYKLNNINGVKMVEVVFGLSSSSLKAVRRNLTTSPCPRGLVL